MIEERQVRTRGLQLRQAVDEGLLVPPPTLNETERRSHAYARRGRTTRRRWRGKVYASPPNRGPEGEWRIFLMGLVRDAFAEREQALAAETDDEFRR